MPGQEQHERANKPPAIGPSRPFFFNAIPRPWFLPGGTLCRVDVKALCRVSPCTFLTVLGLGTANKASTKATTKTATKAVTPSRKTARSLEGSTPPPSSAGDTNTAPSATGKTTREMMTESLFARMNCRGTRLRHSLSPLVCSGSKVRQP